MFRILFLINHIFVTLQLRTILASIDEQREIAGDYKLVVVGNMADSPNRQVSRREAHDVVTGEWGAR